MGTAAAGILIQAILGAGLKGALPPDEARRIMVEISKGIGFIKGLQPDLREVVRKRYSAGIQSGFTLSSVLIGMSAVSTWWWKQKKMS